MPKTKTKHTGTTRGLVSHRKNQADIKLDIDQALILIKQIAEALRYQDEVKIEAHWAKKRGGTYLIKIYNP